MNDTHTQRAQGMLMTDPASVMCVHCVLYGQVKHCDTRLSARIVQGGLLGGSRGLLGVCCPSNTEWRPVCHHTPVRSLCPEENRHQWVYKRKTVRVGMEQTHKTLFVFKQEVKAISVRRVMEKRGWGSKEKLTYLRSYEGHKTPKVLLYKSPEPITSYSSLNSGASPKCWPCWTSHITNRSMTLHKKRH